MHDSEALAKHAALVASGDGYPLILGHEDGKNALTYQKGFVQMPRNSRGKLTSGRSQAYPVLNAKKGTHDFSKPAFLVPAFMNGDKHKVDEAHKELRANINGFYVEMPLDWGAAQGETAKPPGGMTEAIAANQTEPLEQTEMST